ncbi:toll/interleukin-1 receptor domain-containing protein [Tahibacter sp.]|uniref:toll/interleukin-1 receptor domain-containing protein n=1 Tax=Tahibacter sp. TaxID=2056211 RepID=UPI0028C4EA8D|nr:toll/interleukin-1 receptor domain-containing protein [Tahibacter sp.]
MAATTLFISYAHRDEAFLRELLAYLQPLVDVALIDVWHDRRMIAGDAIFPSIEIAQDRARIVLLLVSESYLASVECAREMWRALEKREKGRTAVVPVILRRCDWRAAPYAKFNALPTDGAPIDSADDREQSFLEVVQGVRTLAERFAHADVSARRRRFTLAIGAGVPALIVAAAWLALHYAMSGAPPSPAETSASPPPGADAIDVPAGVLVIAEAAATAPGGVAWNPGASGQWRLPNLFLCFRRDNVQQQASEVCQPTVLGMRHARVIAHGSAIHFADTYPAMTSWSPMFSVELKNQRVASVSVLGRGRCRFGVPCRLLDPGGGGHVAAEVLVLPAPESVGEPLVEYLQRCVDPDSLLAHQWQSLLAAAGFKTPDIAQISYVTLAQGFVALRPNALTPSMTDAVLASGGSPLQRGTSPDTFRGSILRRVAMLGDADDWAPLERNEVQQALAALRRNLQAANVADLVHRGCRRY